jgi:minor fimbrial subunit
MSDLMKCIGLVAVAGMMSTAIQAANLNVNGIVVASSCIVDTGSVSQDVDFGRLHVIDLPTAGSGSDWQPFEVKLNGCPVSTSRVVVNFTGTPVSTDATLFANSGTAQNVAIQMAQDANRSNVLPHGSSMTVNVDAQRKATYALAGRLIRLADSPGPGTVSSVVQMNFTYQ